jgi:thymidylate kinase
MQVQLPPLARRILFEADRLAHQDLIRGFLEVGTWVVSDRCAAVSNHCYAEAEGTPREFLEQVTALDPHRIHPDLVLLVSTPDEAADVRLKRGQGAQDPAERDPRILRSVRGAYGRLFDMARLQHSIEVIGGFRMSARVVPGNNPPDEVADLATRIVVGVFPALGQKSTS